MRVLNTLARVMRSLTRLGPLSEVTSLEPPSSAGVPVSEMSMLGLSSVFACVRNLAEDIAKLPLVVYKRDANGGRQPYTAHSAYRVLHSSANSEMTAFAMRQAITASALLFGRGVGAIEWTQAGRPVGLWPLEPWCTNITRDSAGNLYVDYQGRKTLRMEDVIYIPGFTFDGVCGEMVARHGRDSVGLAIAAQQYAATFFGNGAVPGIILSHPGKLSPEGENSALDRYEKQHKGARRAHRPHIVAEGIKVEKISYNPEESQAVESRQFSVEDVARWFRMPPHKIGHLLRATGWSTLEATNTDYVVDTLMPWLARWEQECSRKLFGSEDVFCEHKVQGMLRGDTAARSAFYRGMFEIGALSANEIRAMENLNPIGPDGDKYFVSSAFAPIDQARSAAK